MTGGFDIKATYDYWDMGVFYGTFHLPNTDSSLATVKFLRKGTNLYIGLQSNDKSICKFDWEGDGIFLKIKRSNGTDAGIQAVLSEHRYSGRDDPVRSRRQSNTATVRASCRPDRR